MFSVADEYLCKLIKNNVSFALVLYFFRCVIATMELIITKDTPRYERFYRTWGSFNYVFWLQMTLWYHKLVSH